MSTTENTNDLEPFDENGRQYAWDSVSYGWLVECPRKYYNAMRLGITSKENNVHLTFGILFQKADELYEKDRAEGYSYEEALHRTVKWALIASYPWNYHHQVKTRENLIRSIIWYREQYRSDPFETLILANGKPAVELSFNLDVGNRKLLCGHLDKLGAFAGSNYFKDVKTTGSTITPYFFQKFDLDVQMDIYSFASQIIYKTPLSGGLIDGVQVAVGITRSQRGFTYRTPEQNKEFLEQFHYYTGEYLNQAERAGWPMNKKACLNGRSDDPTKEATGCIFRDICSKTPHAREEIIETQYTTKRWNPLEVR